MWKKTLVAAAVASISFPGRPLQSAEPAPAPQQPPPPPDSDTAESQARLLGTVRVQAAGEDEGFKAESQTTSSKIALSLRETPQSVTVITQQSLKDRQVTDFGQALELSAGVDQYSGTGPFAGQAGFGFNDATIRGIPIDALNDVREDGFINTTYYAMPDMALYDRIEVIKGPNSVVYGRGSAGGLINRIRKKPLAEALGEVALTAGAFDTYRTDVDLTGPLSASGAVLGRLVAAYGDEGSFVEGVRTKRTLFAPSVDIHFDSGTRVLLEGLYQHDSFVPNTGIPLLNLGDGHFTAPNIRRSLYVGVPTKEDNNWDIYSGNVTIEQPLPDGWLATLRLNKNRTKTPIREDRYAYGLSDAGDTLLIRNDFAIDRDIWAGELKISGDVDIASWKVKVAAGMEYSDNDYHRRGAYAYLGYANIYLENFSDPPDVAVSPGQEYTTHDWTQGFYLQTQVRPIERLSVLLGLRYDRTESEFNAITFDTISRKQDHALTGRLGTTYELSPHVSVYGVYAQSFLPVLSDVGQNGNILDPETGEIFEAGLKTEWFERRLGINIAAYRIDREHIPVAVPTGPAEIPYSVSSGLQRSQGFEVEINGQPLPGWNLSLAYNHVDSSFKDPNDSFYGQRPGGSADWQLGLYSSYQLQSGLLKGFGFGGSVFAIGERGLSPYEHGTLDGYQRVDLNFFYKGIPGYDFALSVRNVFDERYIEGADRSSSIAQFGSPPAWLLTVRHQFGW